MTQEQWDDDFAKTIGVFLNGEEIPSPGPHGERIVDDSFLLLFNAHEGMMEFTIPTGDWGEAWEVVIDTRDHQVTTPHTHKAGEKVEVIEHSIVVLRRAG
jgi:glycogen operon protein